MMTRSDFRCSDPASILTRNRRSAFRASSMEPSTKVRLPPCPPSRHGDLCCSTMTTQLQMMQGQPMLLPHWLRRGGLDTARTEHRWLPCCCRRHSCWSAARPLTPPSRTGTRPPSRRCSHLKSPSIRVRYVPWLFLPKHRSLIQPQCRSTSVKHAQQTWELRMLTGNFRQHACGMFVIRW